MSRMPFSDPEKEEMVGFEGGGGKNFVFVMFLGTVVPTYLPIPKFPAPPQKDVALSFEANFFF